MKKIISLLLAMVLVIGLIPGVFAAEGDKYLALGDSITAGSALNKGERAFPQILAETNGWSLTNLGTDGMTTESLLAQVKSGSIDESIADAKVITITVGGNDVMHTMYDMVVNSYNASYDPDINREDVTKILMNQSDSRWFTLLMVAVTVLNGSEEAGIPPFAENEVFLNRVAECAANLKEIMACIRALNADAPVIITTQYNPYKDFSGMYELVGTSIDAGAKKLNAAIEKVGDECGYEVVDVYSAFQNSTEKLCNATTSPMNLDFHPNARGHEVIAQLIQEIADSLTVKYLALGDNITAGTALNEGESSFPEILAENNGWVLTNMAVNGMTSESLLAQVSAGDLDQAIQSSKIITITVGGNDMMDLLYKLVVDSYNASNDPDITADDVIPIMNNSEDPRWMNLAFATLGVLNGDEDNGIPAFPEREEFKASIAAFSANMQSTMAYIRKLNPDATVIVPTQYNPYQKFTGLFEVIASSVNKGAEKLNAAITSGANQNGYVAVDIFTTFKNSDENLCNATADPLNMDFHPNARGHEVIAARIQGIIDNPFVDVPAGQFYFEPVLWAVENGITNGASATTFNPDGQCQRAQVVTFLWRAAGEPAPTSAVNPFVDVKESDFYYEAVLWAVENDITNGLDPTHFGPLAICNRAQVVTFLYRANGNPAVATTECPFTDVEAGKWYEAPILWAVENGITNGMGDGTFGVDGICNRAHVVTFLYRAQ